MAEWLAGPVGIEKTAGEVDLETYQNGQLADERQVFVDWRERK